jgi:phage terminase large subunit-like protein
LHPARYSAATVSEMENDLGANASAQLQQNPIPRTGGLLEEQHLRYEWIEPPKNGYWIQIFDFAARGTEATHSAVHGALWCSGECETWNELTNTLADRDRGEEPTRVFKRGPRETKYFLMDEIWGIWTVPESERQFELVQALPLWQGAAQRIIEAKAAGIGILQRYERKFSGVVAFHEVNDECQALAQLGKLDRHRANLGEYHAGRVLLPPWKRTVPDPVDGRDGPGPDAYRREMLAFPRGARNDRVDTSSMALARLTQGVSVYYAAVRELAKQARANDEYG